MKKFKKVIALGLAAMAAVSAMSVSAMAAGKESLSDMRLPTISEVDTSQASPENPVTYVDENTGTVVTIYDPDITVESPEIMPCNTNSVVVDGRIYV